MAFLLGIDTGGTYTDAVLMEALPGGEPVLVSKAKALTTRDDLAEGIDEAVGAVLDHAEIDRSQIGLVSLSTTLATNALVESHGGRVALVAIGFDERDLDRAGLSETMAGDPVIRLPGGHTTHGGEAAPLDLSGLDALDGMQVSGVAVAGLFSVRNPAHEIAVRDAITARTSLPVTCSHELSARLNGPKRALTTVLNARLVPLIARLLDATSSMLATRTIEAPLMVVRGDGALVSADFARARPIETILSGPAASLVGARFLTGLDEAVVNDIGGTTSDVAVLTAGRPAIDPDGARVGNHRTMVEAVAMRTFGLGGDSAVQLTTEGLSSRIVLGPQRAVPVSLLALTHPDAIHAALDAQARSGILSRHDARFAWRVSETSLDGKDGALLARIGTVPEPVTTLLRGHAESGALDRLAARGLVRISGPTPSDAQHVLGTHTPWDSEAATKTLGLLARRKGGNGKPVATDATALANAITDSVERRSAEIVLETAFAHDGGRADMLDNPMVGAALDARRSPVPRLVRVDIALDRPIIGLGASARLYHPPAADLLGTKANVPRDADVANAIGAVVGQVAQRAVRTVSQPAEGRFQISGVEQPFSSRADALAEAERLTREQAIAEAQENGVETVSVVVDRDIREAEIEGRTMLVEAIVTATASGRPRVS